MFLDAYAGTGAVGIEALSRGARLAVFIEKDRKAVEVIRKNLESLKIEGRSNVIRGVGTPVSGRDGCETSCFSTHHINKCGSIRRVSKSYCHAAGR